MKSSRNLNGAGNADRILTYLDFQYCQSLEQCLQGKIAGVIINNGKAYSVRSPGRPMLIILDGMQMTDMRLDELNTNDIGSVKILKNASYLAIYGGQASGGAHVITTKTGDIDYSIPSYKPAVDMAKGFLIFKPLGYSISQEFYSPAYPEAISTGNTDAALITSGNNALTASKISNRGKLKDLRTTIYWKPNSITDTAGKTSVTYYNSDGKGQYHIVVKGISPSVAIGRQTLSYTLK